MADRRCTAGSACKPLLRHRSHDYALRPPTNALWISLWIAARITGGAVFASPPTKSPIGRSVKTLTRFPIRRYEVLIGIADNEDIGPARELLFDVAHRNPLCLEESAPLFIFQGFGDSALSMQFSVWATRENFLELRNTIHEEIKQAFDTVGIEIPFPHRSLYAGSVS